MSLRSFRTVCFATPVMRQVAFMELPSTKAEITAERLSVARRFMPAKIACISWHVKKMMLAIYAGMDYFVNISEGSKWPKTQML